MAGVGASTGTSGDLWGDAEAAVNAAYALHDSYSKEDQQQLLEYKRRAQALLEGLHAETNSQRAKLLELEGKLHSASPAHDATAELLLTKAVKLDPTADKYHVLAECLWKGGQLQLAKRCFEAALALERSADTLCHLSMLLRTMSNSSDSALVSESLTLAKEAVALDVTCGKAWLCLGNAFLTTFFVTTGRHDHLGLSLKAYQRAMQSPVMSQGSFADLHYNRAIAMQHTLDYAGSLDAFAEAHRLGPELNASAQRFSLLAFARKWAEAIDTRGHMPRKRLQKLQRGLRQASASQAMPATFGGLHPDENEGVTVNCAVVSVLEHKTSPVILAAVDAEGMAIGVCLYSMGRGNRHVPGLFATLSIAAPCLREVRLETPERTMVIRCIVVKTPAEQLAVSPREGS